MSSFDKTISVKDWVRAKEVYSEFAAGDEGLPASFDSKEWLKETCAQTAKVDFDEKFEQLTSLWGEVVLYVIALDNEMLLGELKSMLNAVLPQGYQPRHGKVFSEKCHKLLGAMYDMGVRTQDEVAKALDAVRVDYLFSGKSRANATSVSANRKAIEDVVEDFKNCIKQISEFGLVKDAFYSVDERVL